MSQIVVRMLCTGWVACLGLSLAMPAGAEPSSDDAEGERTEMAHRVYEKLGLSAGRVVLLVPTRPKGEPIAGLDGFRKVQASDLSQADFEHGSRVAVFTMSEGGAIETREALVVKHGEGLVVLDEGEQRGRPSKAGMQQGGPGKKKKRESREKPGSRDKRDAREQGARENPGQQHERVRSRGLDGSDGIADYTAGLDDGSTTFVTASSDATTGAWSTIEIENTEYDVECYDLPSTDTDAVYGNFEADCTVKRLAQEGERWFGKAPICKTSEETCRENGMSFITFDNYGEGALCLLGQKVLCGPLAEGESEIVYIGKAPYCNAQPKDCTDRGLVYEGSFVQIGDGPECKSGEKVKCRTPNENDAQLLAWIGTAPFCAAKEEDCAKNGMELYLSGGKAVLSPTGNEIMFNEDSEFVGNIPDFGKKCTSGKKVLCTFGGN